MRLDEISKAIGTRIRVKASMEEVDDEGDLLQGKLVRARRIHRVGKPSETRLRLKAFGGETRVSIIGDAFWVGIGPEWKPREDPDA
jgi:hypothetical protein